ncbi:uncharacterized protein [Aegilops tauschii subsp. strangulata]|uniref:uncharacterized protein n=1 Tax=Aegilops tauschii subsp. strangulata TaxID=200361 RepID=UPI003CC84EBB
MVAHKEGEIMLTEQDPMMECKEGHLACANCRGEHPGNQRQCQKRERGGGFDVRNTAMDAALSSVRVECPHEGLPVSWPRRLLFAEEDDNAFFMVGGVLDISAPITISVVCITMGASPPPHYVAKVWADGQPGEPKGRTDTVEVEIKVTSSKEPGAIAM